MKTKTTALIAPIQKKIICFQAMGMYDIIVQKGFYHYIPLNSHLQMQAESAMFYLSLSAIGILPTQLQYICQFVQQLVNQLYRIQ